MINQLRIVAKNQLHHRKYNHLDAAAYMYHLGKIVREVMNDHYRRQYHAWLQQQTNILARRAHELSNVWMDDAESRGNLSLEEWLTNRPLASITPNGMVDGTALPCVIALRQHYCNIAFGFRLKRQGDQLIIIDARRKHTCVLDR